MNITCPYCYSDNISRATTQQSSNNSFSSMAGAGIGASIAKSLPTPFSPLLGGLAGAVVGPLALPLFHNHKRLALRKALGHGFVWFRP